MDQGRRLLVNLAMVTAVTEEYGTTVLYLVGGTSICVAETIDDVLGLIASRTAIYVMGDEDRQ